MYSTVFKITRSGLEPKNPCNDCFAHGYLGWSRKRISLILTGLNAEPGKHAAPQAVSVRMSTDKKSQCPAPPTTSSQLPSPAAPYRSCNTEPGQNLLPLYRAWLSWSGLWWQYVRCEWSVKGWDFCPHEKRILHWIILASIICSILNPLIRNYHSEHHKLWGMKLHCVSRTMLSFISASAITEILLFPSSLPTLWSTVIFKFSRLTHLACQLSLVKLRLR